MTWNVCNMHYVNAVLIVSSIVATWIFLYSSEAPDVSPPVMVTLPAFGVAMPRLGDAMYTSSLHTALWWQHLNVGKGEHAGPLGDVVTSISMLYPELIAVTRATSQFCDVMLLRLLRADAGRAVVIPYGPIHRPLWNALQWYDISGDRRYPLRWLWSEHDISKSSFGNALLYVNFGPHDESVADFVAAARQFSRGHAKGALIVVYNSSVAHSVATTFANVFGNVIEPLLLPDGSASGRHSPSPAAVYWIRRADVDWNQVRLNSPRGLVEQSGAALAMIASLAFLTGGALIYGISRNCRRRRRTTQ